MLDWWVEQILRIFTESLLCAWRYPRYQGCKSRTWQDGCLSSQGWQSGPWEGKVSIEEKKSMDQYWLKLGIRKGLSKVWGGRRGGPSQRVLLLKYRRQAGWRWRNHSREFHNAYWAEINLHHEREDERGESKAGKAIGVWGARLQLQAEKKVVKRKALKLCQGRKRSRW